MAKKKKAGKKPAAKKAATKTSKKAAPKKAATKAAKKAASKAAPRKAAKAAKPTPAAKTWTNVLNREIDAAYAAIFGCLNMVSDSDLNWKPNDGHNWMSTGQLLEHIGDACGMCMKGFVENSWAQMIAEAQAASGTDADGMMPSADKMPASKSVAAARAKLEADKSTALAMVKKAGEHRLATEHVSAPWGSQGKLGEMLLDMTKHLRSHQSQLFYYLKLQGKPVHTGTLWGMPG